MADVPTEWLHALAKAWPLRSKLARRWALDTIAPFSKAASLPPSQVPRGPPPVTPRADHLAGELDEELQRCSRGLSLEHLQLIRTNAWSGEQARDGSLYQYLKDWAHEVLPPAEETLSNAHAAAVRRWRWASLAVPPDLLHAAYAEVPPSRPWVTLAPAALREVLRRGVAETHLHLGAAVSFTQLWCEAMDRAASLMQRSELEKLDRHSPPFASGAAFATALGQACVARVLLAWRLTAGHALSDDDDAVSSAAESLARRIAPASGRDWKRTLPIWVGALARGALESGPRSALTSLAHEVRRRKGLTDLFAATGRGRIDVPDRARQDRGELLLTFYGMRELRGVWRRLFWQYQRLRTATFEWLVLEPGTPGLGWFARYYQRIELLADPKRSELSEALDLERSTGLRLVALEGRKGFKRSRSAYRGLLADAYEHAPQVEVGVSLHWIKEPGRDLPSDNRRTLVRYGDWVRDQQAHLEVLERVSRAEPWAVLVLRGADVASNELGVPTWAVRPLYAQAREIFEAAATYVRRCDPSLAQVGLDRGFRATAHAGEEWFTPHDGVRRLGELLLGEPRRFTGRSGAHASAWGHQPILREGDRIGHALALGMPRGVSCDEDGCVLQPAEERLWDLSFELALVRRGLLETPNTRVLRVRQEVREIWRAIAWEEIDLPGTELLVDVYEALHSRGLVGRLGYPRLTRCIPAEPKWKSIHRLLGEEPMARRARRPLWVRWARDDEDAAASLQRCVRREIAARRLVVETNPSSNLLIGDLGLLGRHPSRQDPPPGDDADDLRLSVNDDDPITFSTRLEDEYAYWWAGHCVEAAKARRRGPAGPSTDTPAERSREALRAIDLARQTGLESRFTIDLRKKAELLAQLRRAKPVR
ncbi:MAG: hypothetical protein KF729_31685 [Sandaracinaceae bacterium]|nr:hypothetical protein [Sandaracinaceae bacterium]